MKLALIGYGKMGKAIEEIALERGHEVVLRIGRSNVHEMTRDKLGQADAAIEFTGPHSAFENIHLCLGLGVPVISGSTGWTERLEELKAFCNAQQGTFIYASNFSVGVNIFFEINKKLASLMSAQPGYDVQLEEIHHTQKKDAPSGTAITLAEQVLANNTRKKKWVNEQSTDPADLVITSKRIDPAPGTHTVTYTSSIDDISITHTAHNRKGFAAGAVLAAEFTRGKTGFFTMKDVLHI